MTNMCSVTLEAISPPTHKNNINNEAVEHLDSPKVRMKRRKKKMKVAKVNEKEKEKKR